MPAPKFFIFATLIFALMLNGSEIAINASKTPAQLSNSVQNLANKIHPLYEECRSTYHDLCEQVLERLIKDLVAKNIQPNEPPLFFELTGSLTQVSTYKIKVTYSRETPSIIVQTSFEWKQAKDSYFKCLITPVIEVTIPLKQPSLDLAHPYLDPEALYIILAHELGHVWQFDAIKIVKLAAFGVLPGVLAIAITAQIFAQKYLFSKATNGQPSLQDQFKVIAALEAGGMVLAIGLNKCFGSYIRIKEYAADKFINNVAPTIDAHKQAILFMARFHTITSLEQAIINCYYDNALLRLWARFTAFKRPQTHPYPYERMHRFINEWQALREKELIAEGYNTQEATLLARNSVSEEYTQMISAMYEFDPKNFDAVIMDTYQWKPDTQEKKNILLQQLAAIKQSLLNAVKEHKLR